MQGQYTMYIPCRKYHKNRGFLMFSAEIEKGFWPGMGKVFCLFDQTIPTKTKKIFKSHSCFGIRHTEISYVSLSLTKCIIGKYEKAYHVSSIFFEAKLHFYITNFCRSSTYETFCAIWYNLFNLKTAKSPYDRVLLLLTVKLQPKVTKSNTPPLVFLTFVKLYKWCQTA